MKSNELVVPETLSKPFTIRTFDPDAEGVVPNSSVKSLSPNSLTAFTL